MEKFFHDLLISEKGIYTLWGSKPVTEVILYHYTEAEWQAINASLSSEEQENCYICEIYDLPENWEKWEKIAPKIKIENYLLYRSHFSEDRRISYVYFVNIPKATKEIKKHFNLFAAAVGFEFDPQEVILEMPNQNSKFWEAFKSSDKSPLLWGILFGYGESNSLAYYKKHFEQLTQNEVHSEEVFSSMSAPDPEGQVHISIENFEIPGFISFTPNDKVITKYEKERKSIKNIYSKKDFLDVTLVKLSSKK